MKTFNEKLREYESRLERKRSEREEETMHICDDGHDEVAYEDEKCPVCEKMDEISKLEDTVDELRREIAEA